MNLINQSVLLNLEQQTTWSAKVGPRYNKIESTSCWTTLHSDGVREFGHEAPALGGWLSGLNDLPLPAGWTKGTVTHSARMMFDESILDWKTGSRIAVEFDCRTSNGTIQANNSNQINLSEGGMWQVDPGTGVWTDTGVKVSLKPLVWHDIAFESALDFTAGTYGFNALTVDGVRMVPTSVLKCKMLTLNWAKGANLQVQQCRQVAGVGLLWAKDIGISYVAQ